MLRVLLVALDFQTHVPYDTVKFLCQILRSTLLTIPPTPRERSYVRQRPQSAPRLRNYCCSCLQEPLKSRVSLAFMLQHSENPPKCRIHIDGLDRRVSMAYLHISVGHTYIIRIGLEVLGRCHDRKLDCPLIAKSLISPFSYRSDLFHSCDAIVCNKHLR